MWCEVRRANDLKIHSNRVEIYRAICDLRHLMQTKGVRVTENDVACFSRPSQEAALYFSNRETSEKVREYFDVCWGLAGCTRKLDREGNSSEQRVEIQREQDRLDKREQSLFVEAERLVMEELRGAVKPRSTVV